MKIESVKVGLPTKIVTNEDILQYIRENSVDTPLPELKKILARTEVFLRAAGSKNRRWLNDGETPIKIVTNTMNQALLESGWEKESVDLVVYVGVGRGFIEPGDAYMLAQHFGFKNAQCFDLIEACMSWGRAVYLIHSLFKCRQYKRAIIINAEFTIEQYISPTLYNIQSVEQLDHFFAAYTIGEAGSVTLLSNDIDEPGYQDWEFHFSANPNLADLCTIPIGDWQSFCSDAYQKIGVNGSGVFTSYGVELHRHGAIGAFNVFNSLTIPKDDMDVIFTHASSGTMWKKWGRELGVEEKMYHISQDTGNLVSASVPAAMALAYENKKLKRGDRVVCWIISAGMSFGAFSFKF